MQSVDTNHTTDHGEAESNLGSFLAGGAGGGTELDDDAADIGARLQQARESAGISQRQIADQLGVRESTVDKWESGVTSPRGHRVSKLAGMLGVSISWILMGHGIEPSAPLDDVDLIRGEIQSIRARLEDAVNELAVLEQRLSSIGDS